MLINLTNHPLSKWSEEQKQVAIEEYGYIEDLPFPQIAPEADETEIADLAKEFTAKCKIQFEQANIPVSKQAYNEAVHIMGEMTFTYQMVKLLSAQNIKCIASTTKREAIEKPDGTKISVFQFVKFRTYIQ